MTFDLTLTDGTILTYQYWKSLTPTDQAKVALSMGYNTTQIDTALSLAEQVERGTNAPPGGGALVSTSGPLLSAPLMQLVTPESLVFVQELLTTFGFTFEEALSSLAPGTKHEDELAYVQQAIQEYSQVDISADNPATISPETRTSLVSALSLLWDKVDIAIRQGARTLPEAYQDISSNIASKNSDDVKKALFQLVDLAKFSLTEDQKKFVEGKLDLLAKNIASSVAEERGASFFIRLGIPELLVFQFSTALDLTTDPTISSSDQTIMFNVLMEAANNLSAVNFTQATSEKPPILAYTQLTSQNAEQMTTLMNSLFFAMDIPEESMTEQERSLYISALVSAFTSEGPLPKNLTSSREAVVSSFLSSLFEKLVAEGKLPAGDSAAMLQKMYLIPMLAKKIAAINEEKCLNDLYSSDTSVIDGALRNLGELPPMPDFSKTQDLPPEKVLDQYGGPIVMESYLKVLVKALSFMAQIRSIISSLEGELSQGLGAAKLSEVADQIAASTANYKAEMAKIQKETAVQLRSIHKAALMRWLMPLITIIVTIISTIAAVLAIVFSGGAAAPGVLPALGALEAKLIAATVAVTVIVTVALITIIDAGLSIGGKKGIFASITEAVMGGVEAVEGKPKWLKALINAIIQLVVMLLVTALTLGGALIVGAARMATQTIMEAFSAIWNQLGAAMIDVSSQIVMGLILQPLLSSGLLMELIQMIVKAVCGDNEKENAIIATIIMVLVSLIMIAACSCARGALTALSKPFSQIGRDIKGFIEQIKNGIIGIKDSAISFGKSIPEILTSLKTGIERFLQWMLQAFRTGWKASGEAVDELAKVLQEIQQGFRGLVQHMQLFYHFLRGSSAAELARIFGASFMAGIRGLDTTIMTLMRNVLDLIMKVLRGIGSCIKTNVTLDASLITFLLETLSNLLKIGLNIGVAVLSFKQARLQEELAKLQFEVAELESSLSFLENIVSGSLDQSATMKHIGEDSESQAQDWAALVNLVSMFIGRASEYINALTTRGAGR